MLRCLSLGLILIVLLKPASFAAAADEPLLSAIDTLKRILDKEQGLKSGDGVTLRSVNLTADGRLIVVGSVGTLQQRSRLEMLIQGNKASLAAAFEKKPEAIKTVDLSRVEVANPDPGKKPEDTNPMIVIPVPDPGVPIYSGVPLQDVPCCQPTTTECRCRIRPLLRWRR